MGKEAVNRYRGLARCKLENYLPYSLIPILFQGEKQPMNLELWHNVGTYLRSNSVGGAAIYLESQLRATASNRFMSLADLHFTNSPGEVLRHINKFITICKRQFDVRAVYLEMNGFDINYDHWYFDAFAYEENLDDFEDLDWLSDWSSPDFNPFTLTGLEQTQDDFRWYMENKIYDVKTHTAEAEFATLLVMVRFLQLVQLSLDAGKLATAVPVFATAHDFDLLGRFTPKHVK